MIKRLCAVVLVGVGVLSGVLFGQERFDLKVRNYFFAGFSGDAASLEKGMKICEDALAAEPKNAEALVWHGAGTILRSRSGFPKGRPTKGRGTVAARAEGNGPGGGIGARRFGCTHPARRRAADRIALHAES